MKGENSFLRFLYLLSLCAKNTHRQKAYKSLGGGRGGEHVLFSLPSETPF